MSKIKKLNLSELDDISLIYAYSTLLKELKNRKIVRSKNITGDLGEYVTIDVYNTTRNLPKLQLAPSGTRNVDALSRDGERYSIKTITLPNKTTGVFYGLHPKGSDTKDEKNFEYVIIVVFDDEMGLVELIEIDWKTFIKFKKWHKRMKAWYVIVTKSLRKSATRITKG